MLTGGYTSAIFRLNSATRVPLCPTQRMSMHTVSQKIVQNYCFL